MLLTSKVILKRILTEVRPLTSWTHFLECGLGSGCGGGGLVGEDLFGEDLGGEGWERGYAAFEVVAVPVALHVCSLEVAAAEGDLAGIACVEVGGCCCAGHGCGGCGRHDGCRVVRCLTGLRIYGVDC